MNILGEQEERKMEKQSFLPKSRSVSGSVPVADTSPVQLPPRTKVEYLTTNRNPRYLNLVTTKQSYFVFEPHHTVQLAAKYAVDNYPSTDEVPIFNEVHVFFKSFFMGHIPLTDVNVNVHAMF